MNFEQNQYLRGRGIFCLLLLAAIAMSALIGACNNVSGDSMTLNLSYPAITGTTGTAITATNPTWSSTPEGNVAYAIDPALPAGLNMEPGTGIISGTPTAAAAATEYTITATLADNTEKTATISITIKDISDLSDAEKVAADTADLDITSAVGGDLRAVKLDFTLPTTGQKGTAISWEVSSGTAIALSGTSGESAAVTRPGILETDAEVVLKASITLGTESDTKDFTLTVKKQEDLTDEQAVAQDKSDLSANSFQFAQGDLYNQVTQDFTLPTTGGEGSTISWSITSGTAISLSGTNSEMAAVTRPNPVDGDANVELTAAIAKNSASDTKTFTLTVIKKDPVDIASLDSSEFSLTVDDTNATALTEKTHSVTVSGSLSLTAGTDYDLSIEGPGFSSGAVSIADDGSITMTSAIAVSDGGDYTVTATGKGNYTGTVDDTFTLTMLKKALNAAPSFSVSASNAAVTAKTSGTYQGGTIGGSLEFGTDYDLDITTAGGGATSFFSSPSFDSGVITFTITDDIARSDAGNYSLTATGMDNYTGSVSDTFTLTVDAKSLTDSDFTLTVGNTSVTVSTEATHNAAVGGSLTAGTDYGLSITGPGVSSSAVSIANDGRITMTSAIALSDAGSYTVTATGKDNYIGTVSDDFTLTVTAQPTLGEITYANGDFTLDVQITPQSPSGTNSAQADYAMKGSESLPAGLSLAADGTISGTPTAGSSQTDYTIVATGKTGTVYAGEVKDITILISVDNDLASFFDFSLPATQTATRNGQDETMTISIDQNARGFAAGTEYTWAIKKSDDTTPGFMAAANNEVVITAADIPGSSAEGTYKLTAVGQGRYSGEVTKEFVLDLPADALPEAPAITGITPGDTKLVVNWSAPTDTGYHDAAVGEISEYTVYWDTSSGVSKSSATKQTVQAPTTSYEITGLTNGQTYHVIVTATTGEGEGDASSASSDTPVPADALPGAPTITGIAPGDGKLTVSWDAPTDKGYSGGSEGVIDRYTVYWGTSSGLTTSTAIGSEPAAAGTTSHEIDGLTNGQIYYVIVTAATGAGTGPASTESSGTPVPADALPGAPTITGIVPGDSKLVVNWDAPTDKGFHNGSEGMISGYTVYWDTSSGVSKSSATKQTVQDPATSYEISGLSNNQIYHVIVTATTGAGEGNASTAVSGTPVPAKAPPGAPTLVDLTAGDTQVTVSWTAPTDTGYDDDIGTVGVITKYTIYYSTASIAIDRDLTRTASVQVIAPAVLTKDVTALTNNQQLFFRVTAWNAAGESALSAEKTATPVPADAAPGAPTISKRVVGDTKVTLEWTAPTDTGIINGNGSTGVITKYTVYHSASSFTDLTSAASVEVPDPATLTKEVISLTNGQIRYFRVTAWNATGEGALSKERTATPAATPPGDAIPGAPAIGTAVPGHEQVTVSWTEPADTGYDDAAGTVGEITTYTVYYHTAAFDAASLPTTKVEVTDGTARSVDVPNLSFGTTYFFRVTATNATGEGALSGEATAAPTLPANAVPGAPKIEFLTSGNKRVWLLLSEPTDKGYINGNGTKGVITAYTVYYHTASFDTANLPATKVDVTGENWQTVEVTGLTNHIPYFFRVTATNATGEGALTEERQSTPQAPPNAAPGAPAIGTAAAGDTQVTVSWTAPTDKGYISGDGTEGIITGYTVYYHTAAFDASSLPTTKVEVSGGTTTTDVTSLTNGTTYYFRVTATNDTGESVPSGEATATPTP